MWATRSPTPRNVLQPNSRAPSNLWKLRANVLKKGQLTKIENHQQQQALIQEESHFTLHVFQKMYLTCGYIYFYTRMKSIYILCDGNFKISFTKCKYCNSTIQLDYLQVEKVHDALCSQCSIDSRTQSVDCNVISLLPDILLKETERCSTKCKYCNLLLQLDYVQMVTAHEAL